MELFDLTLIAATFLCSLVAGFLFAFAIVVMPGIRSLDDASFLRAFQVIDGVIQKNQPLFIIVWVGSALSLVMAAALGIAEFSRGRLGGSELGLLIGSAAGYVLAVQVPTMRINIPLNNRVQALILDSMNTDELQQARNEFESRWNWWNNLRSVVTCAVAALLMTLLLWR